MPFLKKSFHKQKNSLHLQPQRDGAIAQLVEQRTENPCVAGSIPAGTTAKPSEKSGGFFVWFSRRLQTYLSKVETSDSEITTPKRPHHEVIWELSFVYKHPHKNPNSKILLPLIQHKYLVLLLTSNPVKFFYYI
jgi:hypothetical protein